MVMVSDMMAMSLCSDPPWREVLVRETCLAVERWSSSSSRAQTPDGHMPRSLILTLLTLTL